MTAKDLCDRLQGVPSDTPVFIDLITYAPTGDVMQVADAGMEEGSFIIACGDTEAPPL